MHIKALFSSMVLLLLLTVFQAPVFGKENTDASAAFQKGIEKFEAQDYIDAAKQFAKAEFLANSNDLKFRAANFEARSYREAGYRGKEFEALEKMIKRYPSLVKFSEVVDREYAIGDAYYHGYSDPAFWSLRFIPWLTDASRMAEVYEAALKHAPFAPAGAGARLRLAIHYLKELKNDQAMKLLREVIRIYPDTQEARYAMLELGNALCELSLAGDGDGSNYNEAMSIFSDFRKKYADKSENAWVKLSENRARDAYATRLHNIAEFYYRNGQNDPATVYLLEVMRRFPETEAAGKSEQLLAKLDKSYYPEQLPDQLPPEIPSYSLLKFPKEQRKLLLAPENSNGKFLLPIYDLNLNKEKK